jgi:pilus assembly protein CpaB
VVDIAQNLFSTRRGSILAGTAAAAVAGIVLLVYLHNYRNSVNSGAAPATVLVAKSLIQKGTPGDIIGRSDQFQVASVPKNQLQIGALVDPQALTGRVAAVDIYPGQQLTAAAFAYAAPDALVTKITGNERAMSVQLDAVHGMVGQIGPGDHVDIFEGVNASSIAGNRPIIKLLLQDVPILRAPLAGGSGIYTLKLKGIQVPILAFAADNGRLWFVLRPPSGAKPIFPGAVSAQTTLLGLKAVR